MSRQFKRLIKPLPFFQDLAQLAAQMLKNMIFMLKMGLFLPKNMVLPSTTYCLR
jgi:hypothetical protein